jgi:hypothetical protein
MGKNRESPPFENAIFPAYPSKANELRHDPG